MQIPYDVSVVLYPFLHKVSFAAIGVCVFCADFCWRIFYSLGMFCLAKEKKEKKKLPFGRTISNNLFALKAIASAAGLYMAIYLCSNFIYGILDFLTGNYLLKHIIDGVNAGESIKSLITYVLVLLGFTFVFNIVSNYYWNVVSPVEERKVGAYIQKMLYKKAQEVELACYENPSFYDKYVKAMDESYGRIMRVMRTLDILIARVIALLANSILLFTIDPWLILFGLFPLVLGVFRRLENIARHDLESANKPINRRAAYVKRTYYLVDYAKEMRIGGMYQNMLKELGDTYKDYKQVYKKHGTKIAIYGYIQRFGLDVITILGATLYAVWSVMCVGEANGGMSIGDCIVVLGSIGTISYCLNNLVQNLAEFGEHALFLEDVRYFLEYDVKVKDGEKTAPGGGDIALENVSFRYDGCEEDTLHDISFTWHKGERIALVGANGSGKTTLAKILLRLYDPTSGKVKLNGENIKEFTLNSYREKFGTVFQDYKLFSMTVAENVLLRSIKEGDAQAVEDALKESGAYDKIASFEKGIDTVLTREFDDKGENLSGGEAQKLSLARIFADKTPFVILDEPSSALDPIAEYAMFENMMRATECRSVIFISHRLSSATLADRVIMIEDGRVCEVGSHEDLMSKGGKYAEMFKCQAENYLGREVNESE